jgi:hypothetical protein
MTLAFDQQRDELPDAATVIAVVYLGDDLLDGGDRES